MSYISRVKEWNAGEVLTAADLNTEIDNCIDSQMPEPAGIQHGDILFRGVSAWERLAYSTSGYVLKTKGADADPEWAASGAGFTDPMTTQGDIIIRTGSATARLPASDAGKCLTTGGGSANAAWAGMTTSGDIEYHNGTARARLAKGTASQLLKMNSGGTAPEWGDLDTEQIAEGAITTDLIGDYAVTRGIHSYTAAGVTLSTTNEVEIESITVYAITTSDSAYIWATATITTKGYHWVKADEYGTPVTFRIREDSTTGTIIAAATSCGEGAGDGDGMPVVLIGSDIPGATGNKVYKLTATCSESLNVDPVVSGRKIMALVRSK